MLMREINAKNIESVDIEGFKPGMYIVTLNNAITSRFLKK
jgi:hypothetical protein